MQLLLGEARGARSPVGSVETLQSSMSTTVATAASPAKHSSGNNNNNGSFLSSSPDREIMEDAEPSCPATLNPSDPNILYFAGEL